jgi:hypothetical protein
MLTYPILKNKASAFLAATGMTVEEFEILLVAVETAYHRVDPPDQTSAGTGRQRQPGGGDKGVLTDWANKLLFILVYVKTNPLQSMHGLQFGLSQPQANDWIHRLLPVLQQALADLKVQPERVGQAVTSQVGEGVAPPNLVVDGTERRRQRPTDETRQKAHYSGKTKTHTDKNSILINEHSGQVVYLGPTVAGTIHDTKAVEPTNPVLPVNATLGQDTGFQGYAPPGVIVEQPKKNRKARP